MKNMLKTACTAGLMMVFAGAVHAQATPEALIEQTPNLPEASVLAAAKAKPAAAPAKGFGRALTAVNTMAAGGSEVDNFKAKVGQLRTLTAQGQVGQAAATASAVGMPGVGAAPEMSGAPGGMSMQELQALQAMSPKEQEEYMLKKQATAMGLTVDEVKALQGMNAKQAEAFMKEGDRAQRMMQAQQAQALAATSSTQLQAIEQLIDAMEDDSPYGQLLAAMEQAIEQERAEVAAQLKQTLEKHKGELTAEYYSEAYALWRGQIVKEQARIKALLPEAKKAGNSQAFALVEAYLNATESVLELPD